MAKVSGIDFSAVNKYRNVATVRMLDGSEVELPLIKVRDAGYATILLQRNDTIASKFLTVVGRLKAKANELKDLRDSQEDDAEVDQQVSENIDVVESAFDTIGVMQKRVNELQIESHNLCDEIHEFLKPYLEGTGIIEQLKENDDVYTIHVLQLMLNGMPDETEDVEVAEENPTTQPSQNS